MTSPGVGTPVLYHTGSDGDYICWVIVTHDSWTSDMANNSVSQPSSGQFNIAGFDYTGDVFSASGVTIGTSGGTCSLVGMEAPDS